VLQLLRVEELRWQAYQQEQSAPKVNNDKSGRGKWRRGNAQGKAASPAQERRDAAAASCAAAWPSHKDEQDSEHSGQERGNFQNHNKKRKNKLKQRFGD
jgi:hypothetical protein